MIGALRLDLPITDLDSLPSTQLCTALYLNVCRNTGLDCPALHTQILNQNNPRACISANSYTHYVHIDMLIYVRICVDRFGHRSITCFEAFYVEICSRNWNSRRIHLGIIISCVKCLFPPVTFLNPSTEPCTTYFHWRMKRTQVLTFLLKIWLHWKTVSFCTGGQNALVQTLQKL